MGISGVGSSYTCMYNSSTGKISSKDGNSDEFVSYYNGELSEEESTTLNGYDAMRKYDMERLFWFYQEAGMGRKNVFDDSNGCEYEITCNTVDGAKSEYYMNGEKIFTRFTGLPYLPDEIKQFAFGTRPFKTHEHKPYDPLTNSINIAVGDIFNLGNGYRLTVMEDCVWGDGYGRGSSADDDKMNRLVGQLSSLIHFADQQGLSSAIYTGYGDSSMIIAFLNELGVDTSREFTINGTKCVIKDGHIREVGSRDGIPSSVFNKALKRYEEWLYQPLSSRESRA